MMNSDLQVTEFLSSHQYGDVKIIAKLLQIDFQDHMN